MNNFSLNYSSPVKAVLLNDGDYAYAKIHFDKETLDNLENDLHKVEDDL